MKKIKFVITSLSLTIPLIVMWIGIVIYMGGVSAIPNAIAGFIAGWYVEKIVRRTKEALKDGNFRCINCKRSGESLSTERVHFN